MKFKDIKDLSDKDLEKTLGELRAELMKERSSNAVGKYSQKTARVRELKRSIARVLTKQNQPKEVAKQ